MSNLIRGLWVVSFTVFTSLVGQAQASALQQAQDASKGTREAASVFDGSRLNR